MRTALHDTLLDAHDRLASCPTEAARWDTARRLIADLGADWVTAGTAPRATPEAIALVSTTPAALMRDYIGGNLHQTDPWMVHCARSTAVDATGIGDLPAAGGLLGPDSDLVRLLADHGVRHVCLSPAWGRARPGGIVVYARSTEGAAALRSDAGRASLRVMVATIAAWCRPERVGPGRTGRYATGPTLSPREVEALCWLSQGLRTAEIAWRMGVEPVTVGKHIASARRKLGARTREQALALAIRDGLLPL